MLEVLLDVNSVLTHIVAIYRPPSTSTYGYPTNMFLDEFAVLLESPVLCPGKLVLTGDFNFQVDDPSDSAALKFLDLLDLFNLRQHIDVPTHKEGHTLDLIITRSDEEHATDFFVYDPVISDHFAIHCRLNLDMPHAPKQVITYRKPQSVNVDDFCRDIINSSLCQSPSTSLSGLCDQYENVSSSMHS